jgi:Protein of unknown function (DUF3038)
MQLNISQTDQINLELPIPTDLSTRGCPRSVRMDLDNLVLALEAIDLQVTDVMLYMVTELHLEAAIPNRVSFWRLRNTNPLRRNYQRTSLEWDEARALVTLICHVAVQLNTHLRLLITTCEQISEHKIDALGLQQNRFYVDAYVEQFRSLYKSRMRLPLILNEAELKDLSLQLLNQLLFSSGTAGEARMWHALFDGAIA